MSGVLPVVTVVIAARPGDAEVKAAEGARKLDYPREKLEIIVARGKQPSVQRNAAVREAKGELIYFLDDDSLADSGNLRRAVDRFEDERVQMLGGPNLCPPDAPKLEKEFATVMANPLAFGPSRARYAPIGELRESGEKELILCNLIARKSAFLEAGGFDEALYPNEENALMDELNKQGGKLMYDPEFIVHRRPRPTIQAFRTMLMNYGRGRAEQIRLHPTTGSLLNFAPAAFVAGIITIIIVSVVSGALHAFGNGTTGSDWQWSAIVLGLGVYFTYFPLVALSGFRNSQLPCVLKGPVLSPSVEQLKVDAGRQSMLIANSHFFYGLGFWKGMFTSLKKSKKSPAVDVKLEVVQAI